MVNENPIKIAYNLRRPLQGLYGSWKTWKVMEFIISISRPGKSWNVGESHGKVVCFWK